LLKATWLAVKIPGCFQITLLPLPQGCSFRSCWLFAPQQRSTLSVDASWFHTPSWLQFGMS
jgi:hypothetical protein